MGGSPAQENPPGQPGGGWLRTIVAVLIGLAGAVIIWIATPFNAELIGGGSLTDTYLPPVVLFLVFLLVLFINPALRKFVPSISLTKRQMALAMGIMLVACCLPGQGLLKALPYSIANVPRAVRHNKRMAEAYEKMQTPESLFPAPLKYRDRAPVSEHFVKKLPPGETVPWKAWLAPLWSWGSFLICAWLMMIGIALIVLPQWRRNERLQFPLLELQEALIETPEGHFFPTLLRRKAFWCGLALVFVLYGLVGLKKYFPGRVPAIPLDWDYRRLFAEGALRYTPSYIWSGNIYFVFLGMAFFMPSRIGFSIWFFEIIYAFYSALTSAYNPPFHGAAVIDHRMGAMWSLAIVILWLGRAHWARVFRCVVLARTEEEVRNRVAALMLLVGASGMFLWLWLFVHVPCVWALFFVAFGFTCCLVVTRIVAETGMAFVRMHFNYWLTFIHMVPMKWVALPVLYFGRFVSIVFPIGSRVSVTAMAAHAIGLDRENTPKRQWGIGVLLVGVLIVGLIVCGGTHIWMNYHHDSSINGSISPLNDWGLGMLPNMHGQVLKLQDKRAQTQSYNQWAHTAFGAVSAFVLYVACLLSPRWPLHPIGQVMANSYYSVLIWFSVFLGWFAKVLVLRYGGSRLYRKAGAFFIGLIVGEVFAAVFWALTTAIYAINHPTTYELIQTQPN